MKVRILEAGTYSAFVNVNGFTKAGAVRREVGDVVDYPEWYAKSLVEGKLAAFVIEIIDYSTAEAVWPDESDAVDATDGARHLAEEVGIDLASIEGTGKDGRITSADVRKAAEGK